MELLGCYSNDASQNNCFCYSSQVNWFTQLVLEIEATRREIIFSTFSDY